MSRLLIPSLLFSLAALGHAEAPWWNPAWSQRQPLTVDTGADAAGLPGPVENAAILVRLHDGNFQFAAAAADGSDLRFVAADGKTLLPHQIEKYDGLLNEAFVWVKVPGLEPGKPAELSLYYGAQSPDVPALPAAEVHDEASLLVYHFAQAGSQPEDATGNGNGPAGSAVVADGSLIGAGLRLGSGAPLEIPAGDKLRWTEAPELTVSFWFRAAALASGDALLSFGEGAGVPRLVLENGELLIEAAGNRSAAAGAVAAGTWNHVALVAEGALLRLYLNGAPHATLAASLPASPESGPALVLGGGQGGVFAGEIDEFRVDATARSEAWAKLAFSSQGTSDAAARTVVLGQASSGETAAKGGHSEALEHVMLFGDIAKNMMFDGWIAVGVCVLMIAVGWTVAARKFAYLNSIQKGTEQFLVVWKRLSSDLTAIDYQDEHNVSSLGGQADTGTLALVRKSPLYQIYHIGSEEIKHRLARDKDRTKGLSGRSIQAIRAALDAGLVRATHKLTNGLVYLTISIAGGPYVGLLGTVVGVMITFAIIAKSGEVDVNSIAPGIASALLATVAGLVVAIPALFIYSYLNGRIKNVTAEMQVFIDEFVAKMAEFYPPAGEASPYASALPENSSNDQAA